MLAGLALLRERMDFQFCSMDVDSRPEWVARYGLKVPVLTLEGETVCEYVLDVAKLERALGAD